MKKNALFVLLLISACMLVGCECLCGKKERGTGPVQVTSGPCGPYSTEVIYPSDANGILKLETQMPTEAQSRTNFEHKIIVTNLSDRVLTDVVVTEKTAGKFQLASSTPTGRMEDDKIVWTMDSLEPDSSREITVVGSTSDVSCLQHCVSATYNMPACVSAMVTNPQLSLTKTADPNAIVCDFINATYTVSNRGTGTAKNVKIVDPLTENLETSAGQTEVTINVGDLDPNESQQFEVKLKAQKAGTFASDAYATGDNVPRAEAVMTSTRVTEPVLEIDKTGPKTLYIGKQATYDITVRNTGSGVARDVIVEENIPGKVNATNISEGGQQTGSMVVWNLGSLKPGESRDLSVTYTPSEAATFEGTVRATAYCAGGAEATTATQVSGIEAILLEVVDIADPVEIGKNTSYLITATNQGSAADEGVQIIAVLEDNVEYVGSSGPTEGKLDGNRVVFAPLERLAPKGKATWTVEVKALRAGDVRFYVEMTTKRLERPVEETEATRLYE